MKKTIDYYMNLDYPFSIQKIENEDFSGFIISLCDIPAIESIDVTKEDALANLNDIKYEWFSYAIEEGLNIPEPVVNQKRVNNLTRMHNGNTRRTERRTSGESNSR